MKRGIIGIELFAGCGGLSTGFLDAGLPIAAGFEVDKRAVDAYDYNHAYRGSAAYEMDLASVGPETILTAACLPSVDLILGGPPCQPFSIVGKRLGKEDERANLLDVFATVVTSLTPAAFVLENVPNLAVIHGGAILRRILKRLNSAGYGIAAGIVSAADYGVPQLRRRLFVVGIRGAGLVAFPRPTHGPSARPHVSVRDAIGDLPDAGEFGETGVHNHEPTEHTPGMLSRFAQLSPGARDKSSFHDRLHPDKPSYTLRAGSGNFSPLRPVHYRFDRVITVRESARIQGFRDSFIWPDRIPRLQQYRQVGNAVPPMLAQSFAAALAEQLKWPLQPDAYKGDPGRRPAAITMTDEERRAYRANKIRGASLGLAN
jgi:DNA (cytosine-5)-methyltransferase 1